MRLAHFSYLEFESLPGYWSLDDLALQQINLIVGKNATGKSRTVNVISVLSRLLKNEQIPLADGRFTAQFIADDERRFHYELHVQDQNVIKEIFLRDGETLLNRSDKGEGKIWAEELGQHMSFQTPQNMVAVVARQDAIQHPFLEELLQWAQGVNLYLSSGDMGKQNLFIRAAAGIKPDLRDVNHTALVFHEGVRLHGELLKNAVIEDMRAIGYNISDMGIGVPTTVRFNGEQASHPLGLWVKEIDIEANVDQISMSMGMFRALAVLIHINLQLLIGGPLCFLIDDIGEGLDFDRSSALLSAIVKRIQVSTAQLIMTTNDRYVMNGVPLEYWTVLQREGGRVVGLNSRNRKEDFEDFAFTGLNNIDFLARNYLSRSK